MGTTRTDKKLLPNWPWTIFPNIGMEGIVIVHDITDRESYEELTKWEYNDSEILVVNKVDDENEKNIK